MCNIESARINSIAVIQKTKRKEIKSIDDFSMGRSRMNLITLRKLSKSMLNMVIIIDKNIWVGFWLKDFLIYIMYR